MNYKLYKTFVSHSIQEMLAYRATTFFVVLFGFLFFSIEMIAGLVYFQFTDSLLGWSKLDYLCLIASSSIIQYGYQFFFSNAHENLIDQIIDGELDYVFLRPVNSFWFYALYRLDIPSIINLLIAIAAQIVIFSFYSLTISQVVIYILSIILGIWFVFLLNQLVVMASFWKERAYKLTGLPEYLVDASTRPKEIYPIWIRIIIGWFIPILTSINLPTNAVMGQIDFKVIFYLTIFTVIFTSLVFLIWNKGIKKYQSSN